MLLMYLWEELSNDVIIVYFESHYPLSILQFLATQKGVAFFLFLHNSSKVEYGWFSPLRHTAEIAPVPAHNVCHYNLVDLPLVLFLKNVEHLAKFLCIFRSELLYLKSLLLGGPWNNIF